MAKFIALLSGLIFGFGLIASGMSDPAKVLGFLDLAGAWDPSLAFVMAGAIGVAVAPFAWARRRSSSLLGAPMLLTQAQAVDGPLLLGSAIFGVGWGLSGFCPGPGLVSIGAGYLPGITFAIAMFLGMKFSELRVLGGTRGEPPPTTQPIA